MKKLICLFVAITLLFSWCIAKDYDSSANALVKMGLITGYPDGTLRLENNITRAEFCTIIVKMVGKNEPAISNNFSDVKETHWAYNAINKAAELEFLSGYEDGTFRPSNNITYAESCAILVNLLGYNDELEGTWPNNVMKKSNELKLNEKLEEFESKHLMTRGEVSAMLVSSMNVKIKGDI